MYFLALDTKKKSESYEKHSSKQKYWREVWTRDTNLEVNSVYRFKGRKHFRKRGCNQLVHVILIVQALSQQIIKGIEEDF